MLGKGSASVFQLAERDWIHIASDGALSRKQTRKSFVFWHHLQRPAVSCSETIHLADKRPYRTYPVSRLSGPDR